MKSDKNIDLIHPGSKKPMTKNKKLEWEESSGNVFADLELDQPEEFLARSKLLHQVSTLIKNSKLSQKEVAKKLGVSQPKVSMLVSGRLSEFSTDSLLHYLSILGFGKAVSLFNSNANY